MRFFGRRREEQGEVPAWPYPAAIVHVLLIDDDEDEYVLLRETFQEIRGTRFELEWAPTYEEGLRRIADGGFDAYLVDYRLGARSGIELVREAKAQGIRAPLIMLTGERARSTDMEAMEAGAADFLVKGSSDGGLLERSIRYAITHADAMAKLELAYRQVSGLEEIGRLLSQEGPTPEALDRVAGLIHEQFGYARVAIYQADGNWVELAAQRGYEDPVQRFDASSGRLARVVASRQRALLPTIVVDPDVRTPDEPMEYVAPMHGDGRFLGLIAIAAGDGRELGEPDRNVVATVADRVAVALTLNRALRQ